MLMKGKPDISLRLREKNRESNPEILAAQVLGCMANDSERLGRFLSLTGLTPNTLRQGAGTSQFLAAILEYVLADEPLLIAVAGELHITPDAIAQAHRRLVPREPDDP